MGPRGLAMKNSAGNAERWAIAACGLLTLAGISAHAQASAKRFPITNIAVMAAMQREQVPLSGVQIRITSPITASVGEPELEIRSLTMGDRQSAQLLVECRNPAQCLPFYASASWPAGVEVAEIRAGAARRNDPSKESVNRPVSGDVISFRAGSSATLLLDGERVHVVLRVVCLESGEPGEKVRVTTPDRRQEYIADVIAPGVLKGSF